jgi:nucleotide-binding universal stress UspA family protein
MLKHILLAYDGSPAGRNALVQSRELAQWAGARLSLVAVVPNLIDSGLMEPGFYDLKSSLPEETSYEQCLQEGLNTLQAMGFEASGQVLHGDVIQEITRCAEERSADLIVVGHRHEKSWVRRWWSGSTAKSLVEYAPCSVLIVVTR